MTTQSEVKLDAPTFDAVVDELFGAPDSGFWMEPIRSNFMSRILELTAVQSADFFSASSTENLAILVAGRKRSTASCIFRAKLMAKTSN